MPINTESLEVQKVISEILQKPASGVNEIIRRLFPGKQIAEQVEIFSGVQRLFERVLETSMEKGGPRLIHRLRFSWQTLRRAEKATRRKGKGLPDLVSFENARSVFNDIILGTEIRDCIIQTICSLLRLEENGGFLKHYYDFLMASKPRRLTLPIETQQSSVLYPNLRRIIWWIIRRNRFMYVEPSSETGAIIHFPYLSDAIRGDLRKWSNQADLNAAGISEGIEEEINRWLEYSCLDGDNLPESLDERQEIATAFISDNEMKHKVYVAKSPPPTHIEKQVAELNTELSHYIAENRLLEENIRSLKTQLEEKHKEKPRLGDQADAEEIVLGVKETQEFLKRIDSKYSLDILRGIQLGEDHSITIKNFIAHFFYALRKTGLQNYPDAMEFDLEYEKSNLYECIGFQVELNSKRRVRIERKGWALFHGNQQFIVKKAVVRLSSQESQPPGDES